jgi:hypothetical protein
MIRGATVHETSPRGFSQPFPVAESLRDSNDLPEIRVPERRGYWAATGARLKRLKESGERLKAAKGQAFLPQFDFRVQSGW